MLLNYKNEIIPIEITRSKRKTLCLTLKTDGGVLVKAPLFLQESKIREIVEQKAQWIYTKRKEVQAVQSKKIARVYKDGAPLPFRGEEYPMELVPARRFAVDFEDGHFLLYVQDLKNVSPFLPSGELTEEATGKMREELKKWYKKQTKELTVKRASYYGERMKLDYGSIAIKGRKKQWGTCDSEGNLTFNWKLSMATLEALDYVVVHELCHRRHMDHSKQFWGEVKQILPDYKLRQQWLEENAVNMNL